MITTIQQLLKLPAVLLLSVFCAISASSQIFEQFEYVNVDSIKQLLPASRGAKKVEAYLRIAEGYFVIEPDSCMKYAMIGDSLAGELDDPGLVARSSYVLGKAYFYRGQYDEALKNYLFGLDYYSENKDTNTILEIITDISFAYYYSGNNDALLKLLIEVEEQYLPGMEDISQLSFYLAGIGWHYSHLERYERSIHFYDSLLRLFDKYPFPPKLVAHIFRLQGENYANLNDYRKALDYYNIANRWRDKSGLEPYYSYLASVYYNQENFDSAEIYYRRYLELSEDQAGYISKGIAHYRLGKIEQIRGNFIEALADYNTAQELFQWVYDNKRASETKEQDFRRNFIAHQSVGQYREDQALYYLSTTHLARYRLYEEQNLYREALGEYIQYHEILKELNDLERVTAIEDIRSKYEADKKEQQIMLLSQEKGMSDLRLRQTRTMMYGLGGLLLLGLALTILFIRMIRMRAQQRSVVLEQKLLRSQMNPHFIFNAMSNIANLVDKRDNEAAARFLTRFSRLMRHILESTREDFIMLDEELKNLENYLELQKLRLSDKFSYEINIGESITPADIMVLPMLIQPFVENAIEHGIKPKKAHGHILVRFYRKGDTITCEVEDDGIGRQKSLEMKPYEQAHRSYGVSIARERLSAMQKKIRSRVRLVIHDLETESGESSGTRVVIDMPFKMAV
jgi:tetratricopeptide (TPR) repeat protein